MSYGNPGDEASEMDRHMQEDFRRQHLVTQNPHQPYPLLGHRHHEGYPNTMGSAGVSGMQENIAASQYYTRQHHQGGHPHHSFSHPYGTLTGTDPSAGAYGAPGEQQGSTLSLSRMYSEAPHHPHGIPHSSYPYSHMPHNPHYGHPSYPSSGYGHDQSGMGAADQRGIPPSYSREHRSNAASGGSSYPSMFKDPHSCSPEDIDSPKDKFDDSTPGSPSMSDDAMDTPDGAPASPKTGMIMTAFSKKNMPQHRQVENTIVDENGDHQWFTGCVPLGLADDKYWLSELQVYLRSNFAEAFGATEDDIAAPMHGRNKPIVLGQVGIRCMHCKHDNPAERGQQATSYPSQISGIYNSVQQMLRLHLDCCLSMPMQVRNRIEQLRLSCSSRGGRKQYWVDSAKRLGLQDTPHGIHFARDPTGPLPPLTGPSVNYKENRKKKLAAKAEAEKKKEDKKAAKEQEAKDAASSITLERPQQPPVDSRPLVFPDDKPLISDYLYLTLEQMAPCSLMEADRVGCYKTRQVGFPGLACKHCVGQAGCGRYFPASEASLSQTTTSQTIMNHVRNCRRCPIEIRENLEIMKRNRMGPDGKRADKPKHGGRKVFFHRLWCRIQGIPFEEGKGERKESKKKKLYKKPGPVPKNKKKGRKRKSGGLDDDESEFDTDTEDDRSDDSGGQMFGDDLSHKDHGDQDDSKVRSKTAGSMAKRKAMSPWYEGCVRLAKTDDTHWLTELDVFVRSDLVEAFSLKKNDVLDGYGGRKEPAVGQVGIRCVFCKHVDPPERSNGAIAFPDMLSSIHTKVAEMVRLHFPTCPSIPEERRQQFQQLLEKDSKAAGEDSQQYWVDAARDIGLANIPPEGIGSPDSWGITFRRDPMVPSPADEFDVENGAETLWSQNVMVRPADRGLCTDHVLLMLCQVRPCRFRKSDRRAGPGSRGRDRAMGFPGLACMHCANKNSLGRYFPVSAKNLTDNTANSLQSHISACSRCPEHIQASLAYLSHRSILQKAELSGSWKKAFFRKVWDRLHTERTWTALEDEDNAGEEDEEEEYDSDDNATGAYAEGADERLEGEEEEDDDDEEEEDEGGDEGKEEVGDQMNALIKAAAIWLTEQDQAHDPKDKSSRSPKKRAASNPASGNSSRSASLPTKRTRR